MTLELTVVRHGETDWNRQQRFQGQIDVPLNATGRAQAARLGQRLAPERPSLLVVSPLTRAQETAAPLAAAWNLQPQLEARLQEQHFGHLEGMDVPTIQAQHPELWALWLVHHSDFALPGGGESLRQFHGRVVDALRSLAAVRDGQHVAIVTHGGVLDMLWRTAHRLPLDGRRDCAIPNTGINRLRWQDDRLEIVTWGDDAHLQGLPELECTPSR